VLNIDFPWFWDWALAGMFRYTFGSSALQSVPLESAEENW
jgi:hypothetical protein